MAFYIVLGTSHTHGACETNGKHITLDINDMWVTKFERHLGVPVKRLSTSGVTNQNLTQSLYDAFDMYDMTECKGVIAEGRLGTGDSSVALCNFNDYSDFKLYDDTDLRPHIYNTDEFGYKETAYRTFFATYPGTEVDDISHYEGIVENAYKDRDLISPLAIKNLKHYLNQRSIWYHHSDHSLWDDVQEIRNWYMACKLANIPFTWFHWDKNKRKVMGDLQRFLSRYDCVKANLFYNPEEPISCFDGLHVYMEEDESLECECGHLNAKGNEIAWQILKPWIDKWLKNK